MDSLTQIALGAAVGELIGGKKLGNKAMFWGGVAGTIPDLDVFFRFVLSPIDALAAHRGFSHSFVFGILGAFVLAFIVKAIYDSKWYRTIASSSYLLLTILALVGVNRLFYQKGHWEWYLLLISGLLVAFTAILIYRKYNKETMFIPDFSMVRWRWLFFWALVTHPILDCFTAYGTQFLLPFSNYRVAFNNISVVDPLYTIFLLAATMIAARMIKTSTIRRKVNIIGIALSSTYMLFTLYNKYTINTIFKSSLEEKNITYSRYLSNPTMMNNILWYAVAESDSAYHYGFYSLLKDEGEFELKTKLKNRDLIIQHPDEHTIKTLDWFSKSYNTIEHYNGDTSRYTDMRYGPMIIDDKEYFPFNMYLVKNPDGSYTMINNTPSNNKELDIKKAFAGLFKRIGL